jgi:ribosomal-protein-alanine N-acetyltransferase
MVRALPSSSKLAIRPIRSYEVSSLAAAIPDELTEAHVSNRLREQELGYREVLVAESDGELVGTVSMRESGLESHSMHLFALEVAPAHRGHGIGTSIVEHVVAEARRRGCKLVYLEVRVDNRARRLYHRLGFRRVGDAFLNAWWQFREDGSRERIEELCYRMVKRLRPVG